MPVRSTRSSLIKWPDAATVDRAARAWAHAVASSRPEVRKIGYFGSYARGDWGVGSDLDLLIVVRSDDQPFARRGAGWDVTELPVPADVLVYTQGEWLKLKEEGRFGPVAGNPIVWVFEQPAQVETDPR